MGISRNSHKVPWDGLRAKKPIDKTEDNTYPSNKPFCWKGKKGFNFFQFSNYPMFPEVYAIRACHKFANIFSFGTFHGKWWLRYDFQGECIFVKGHPGLRGLSFLECNSNLRSLIELPFQAHFLKLYQVFQVFASRSRTKKHALLCNVICCGRYLLNILNMQRTNPYSRDHRAVGSMSKWWHHKGCHTKIVAVQTTMLQRTITNNESTIFCVLKCFYFVRVRRNLDYPLNSNSLSGSFVNCIASSWLPSLPGQQYIWRWVTKMVPAGTW